MSPQEQLWRKPPYGAMGGLTNGIGRLRTDESGADGEVACLMRARLSLLKEEDGPRSVRLFSRRNSFSPSLVVENEDERVRHARSRK